MNEGKDFIVAHKRVCVCKQEGLKSEIIYLGTVEIDHELQTLDEFYCRTCNSTWQEP